MNNDKNIESKKKETLETQKRNTEKPPNPLKLLLLAIISFGLLIAIGVTIFKVVLPKTGENVNQITKEAQAEEYTALVEAFIPGDTVNYKVTNKAVSKALVVKIQLSIMNTETKEVFVIEGNDEDSDLYYQMAEGDVFEAVNAKDGKSMKMVETGKYFNLTKVELNK